MPIGKNHGGHSPSDEISSIAGKILARDPLNDDAAKAGVPISGEKFNSLLADAKRLAAYVLGDDPKAGPNHA